MRKYAASPRVGTVDPSSRSPTRHERVPCYASETNKTNHLFLYSKKETGGASNNDNFAFLTPAVNFVEILFCLLLKIVLVQMW